MSDCGVCLYSDDCDEYAYDIDVQTQVSDGSIKCCECKKKIIEGVKYELATLYFEEESEDDNEDDRRSDSYKTCLTCAEIANAFYCNGRIYGGCLWDSMYYVFEELTTSCFDRLTTPEAKAELQRRWMEWKFL